MANKTPVWFDAGFGVYSGDDTIHHNYTEATGNVITLERGGTGNEVLQVLNGGETKLKSLSSFSESALTVDAYEAQDALTLNDAHNSDHLLTVRKLTSGTGWITDFKVRDSGSPTDDDIAFRITHDIQTNSPPQEADLFSMGYTNAALAYQELFRFKQSGDFYLVGSSGADLLWDTTGGGNIGWSGGNSPDYIYAVTQVDGGGTVIKAQNLELGPTAANTKTITALQTGSNDPGIRYNSSTSEWELAHDGTTWVKINTGDGNDLDQAYDAFGVSAGLVTMDARNLTWRLSSPYNFTIDDTNGNTYFDAEAATGVLNLGTAAINGHLYLTADGTNSTVAITSTNGISHNAGSSSTWTQSSGNWNVSCSTGNINFTNANGSVNFNPGLNFVASVDRQVNITAGTDNGGYGFDIKNEGTGVSYIQTTNGGAIYISADTGSSAQLVIQSGGNTTISSGRTLNMHVDTAAYDLTLSVPNHASSDILFEAHGSGDIPFNSTADVTLDTTTKNIVGAINELNSGGFITWDMIYANDKHLDIDGAPLVFEQTSTTGYGLHVYRGLGSASTNSPILQAKNSPVGSVDDQPSFASVYEDAVGGNLGTITISKSEFSSTTGVTNADVHAYYGTLSADAADSGGTFRAFSAAGTTVGSWTNQYGFYADANFDYGLYSESLAAVVLAPASSSAGSTHVVDSQYTSPGLASGAIIYHYRAKPTGDAGDNAGGSYYGYLAEGTATGSATKRAFYADQNWEESFYGLAKAYITDSFTTADSCLQVVSSSTTLGAGVVLNGIESQINGHASDPGTASIRGFYANGTATGSAVKYGFYADTAWDYGLYSGAKIYATLSSISSGVNVYDAVVTTSGLGAPDLVGFNFDVTESATDASKIRGVNLSLTPDASASNDTIGVLVDGDWDYGLNSASPVFVEPTPSTATAGLYSVYGGGYDASGAALGATSSVLVYHATITPNAADNSNAYYMGFYAAGSTTGSANKIAFFTDSNWDYGLYTTALSFVGVTPGSAPGGTVSVSDNRYSAASAALGLGDAVRVLNANITANAADNASSGYYGVYAEGSATGSSVKTGFYTDDNWDWGAFVSSSRNYFKSEPANGGGSAAWWTVESIIATDAAGLASNDKVACYKASITDDNNDGGAFYYGLYVTTTDNGSASKRGIYFDSTWPADHYAFWISSGLWSGTEDFGTVTSDINYVDLNLSGRLNSSIEGRCINLDISPDASQSDGSSWYGVRANMQNANANDSVGSFAFHANDNWHYGLYVGNDLSKQQAPGEGTIHVESLSSSAVASGTYYGYSYYHTRHASDTAGALNSFYAQADSASTDLDMCAFNAGNNCTYGVYSSAGSNLFQRGSGEWTALGAAVVNISNSNSSNTSPALFVGSLNTTSSGKCLELNHAYAGGNTEDTRRAIVFNATKTNVRQAPTSSFQENMTNTTTSYWQYQCTTSAQRWYTLGTAARTICAPLYIPHASTIKEIEVVCYHQNVPTSGAKVTLYRHPVNAGSPSISTSLGTTTGALSSGVQTITLSGLSSTVDNTQYSYYVQFLNGVTASSSASYVYIVRVEYDITDFSAGCGW